MEAYKGETMKIQRKVKTSSRKRQSANGDIVKCAIYARCASDHQSAASIKKQIRCCRKYAKRNGWTVVKQCVCSDFAVSGTTLKGRNALLNLVKTAEQRPRLFDRVLIEGTSRLSRNLEDTLWIVGRFESNGIHIISVSKGLDLSDRSVHHLFTLAGMMDERYLQGLADRPR